MIRVMVVDDEGLVRSGLRLILSSAADLEVVATCDGVHAVEEADRHHPHVVLLDLRMPEVDGLTVLRALVARPQPPAVAMLTTFDTEDYVAQALGLGAAGFLLKDTEPEQLVHAVRVLAAGGKILSPKVTDAVIGGYLSASTPGPVRARIATMTPREREVLALIGRGLPNADIAARLHLSPATVKDHVSAVLTKLAVANRVQAAVLARDAGLAQTAPER
ncbi:response regulator transcription factor [Georgenia yuyongxinii]|uniref:Response regulator transcription factor n=1 Tax=Georgenia yuyongxinii TaxID=2589797 RepID=A0A5B8CDT5_9MICO|nr:response regulator transcription factor [Georgenia yuyongxinii]QDC26366.1 response regulator transcription factor [Georgenia yuyongxinii]